MPVINGYEATQIIRRLPGKRGTIPIVALTAFAQPLDREQALCRRNERFLRKPLRKDDLVSMINSTFSNRSMVDAKPPDESEQDAILALKNDFGPAKLEYLFQKLTFDAQSFIAEIRTAIEAGAVDDIRKSRFALAVCSASSAQTMSPNGLQHSNAWTMGRQRPWRTASPSNARAVRVRPNLGCAREARLTANGLRCAPQAASIAYPRAWRRR